MTKVAVKTKVVKKTKVVPVVEVPVVVAPVEVPVVEAPVPVVEAPVEAFKLRFDKLVEAKTAQINALRDEIKELRKLQKDHDQVVKTLSKKKKRVRKEGEPKRESALSRPIEISEDMSKFLEPYGIKKGDLVSRVDVNRMVNRYIKENNLQNSEYRREIIPDAKLKKILGDSIEFKVPGDENSAKVYTYLKLQKYLSKHFPKREVAA
jgi:chromatin remodeling complex protein RSC6